MLFVVPSASTRAIARKISLLRMFAFAIVLGLIAFSAAPVLAACECGYYIRISTGSVETISTGLVDKFSTGSADKFPTVSVNQASTVSVGNFYTGSEDKFSTGSAENFSPGSVTSFFTGSGTDLFVFTDVIESDFFHITDIHADTDWYSQNYNISASAARGPYGMNFTGSNIVSNPIANSSNWNGPPVSSGDPGVQLSVGAGIPANGFVQVAQMNSAREDLLFGTYRALLKFTSVPGTCTSFFWYYNDSQEIDFEALSDQFNLHNNTFPLNLVLQSQQSARQGFSSADSGDWKVTKLPFDPTDGFHEYRIDFIPGKVIYYGDGQILAIINTTAVPTSPGHLILSQWSNGDHGWSAGPPLQRAVSTVGYVKGYFNSSDPARQSAASRRCKDPSAPGAICSISDQLIAPGSLFSEFFSNDPNMTNNQTIYGKSEAPDDGTPDSLLIVLMILVLLTIIAANEAFCR